MYNIWQLIGMWSLLVSVPFAWRGSMLRSASQQILGGQQAAFCGGCREGLGDE